MPVHFSPSRSLKYCFITLRTVEASSVSRAAASAFGTNLCLRCKGHLFVVFEARRVRGELVEEPFHGGELHCGGLEGVHAGAEHGGILESLRVPADVLARHPHAALDAVEGVQ